MAQAKARHEAFPDRFFNVGFAIDPSGEIILKHYKLTTLYPVEHSMTPHDVCDRWVEHVRPHARRVLPGRRHRDRPPGRDDGQRGLVPGERAGPGAERRRGRLPRVLPAPAHRQRVLRDPEPGPRARQQLLRRRPQPGDLLPARRVRGRRSTRSAGARWSSTTRAASSGSTCTGPGRPTWPGRSTSTPCGTSAPTRSGTTGSRTCAPSCTSSSTSEPIYPKNLYLDRAPYNHAEYREQVIERQIRAMVERGVWVDPG